MVSEAPKRVFHVDSKAVDHIAAVSLPLSSPITSYDVEKLDSTIVVNGLLSSHVVTN
jgi:DNA/RNA-binding domain of Phe-tRNA-synthetase-like protein